MHFFRKSTAPKRFEAKQTKPGNLEVDKVGAMGCSKPENEVGVCCILPGFVFFVN